MTARRPTPAPTTTREPLRDRIFAVVRQIPPGRVATYGQVAALAGAPGAARAVGWALASTPDGIQLPWQRVLNASGRISGRAEPGWEGVQRGLLEGEGVVFGVDGATDLERFGWDPDEDG